MAMTPEQMQHEERHAALMAVAHSLTAAERVAFLGRVVRRYRAIDGADVADVLDLTTEHDEFLDQTEPFYEKFGEQLPEVPAVIFAIHFIILMGWELTPGRVWSVLQRAGAVDPPRFPEVEAGLIIAIGGLRAHAGDGNHLLVKARAEQGMRAAGISEDVITEFRESVRPTGLPGYGQNMADIARWVTLVDRYTEMPRKVYDPTDDIAVILAWLQMHGVDAPVRPAITNLRSHLDMRSAETIKSSLLTAYGRTPE